MRHLEYGVRIDSGGSALVTDNHITQIRDTPFSGCQNGVAVLVGRNLNNTSGFGTVVHNTIDNYQKGGVVVDGQANGPSSNAEVAFNVITGIGPTAVIAQNGIQVSRGAIANVHHNAVHDNIYSPATTTGEGILTFQVSSPQVQVHHNDVYRYSDGIGLYTTSNIEVGSEPLPRQRPVRRPVRRQRHVEQHDRAQQAHEQRRVRLRRRVDRAVQRARVRRRPVVQDLGSTETAHALHATPRT